MTGPAHHIKYTMRRWVFSVCIVALILITILIVLFLITRYNLLVTNNLPFTYGDVVTIQSLATGQFIVPGCEVDLNLMSHPTEAPNQNPGDVIVGGNRVSILSANGSAEAAALRWEIVRPPPQQASASDSQSRPSGYVFRNITTNQYLFFLWNNISPVTRITTPAPTVFNNGVPALGATVSQFTTLSQGIPKSSRLPGGLISPQFLYSDSRFIFNISASSPASINSANSGVYTIGHTDTNGTLFDLTTVGGLATAPVPAPCPQYLPNVAALGEPGAVRTAFPLLCSGANPACLYFMWDQTANAVPVEQTKFRIRKI